MAINVQAKQVLFRENEIRILYLSLFFIHSGFFLFSIRISHHITNVIYNTTCISAMKNIFPPTKIIDSLILMSIVKEGGLHGYAITALIEDKMGWKPSQTAVYNSLKSMEQDGLVASEEKIEKGRLQKIYSITPKGKEEFDETHKKMRENMMKNFSRFLSFAQMVSEIEDQKESEAMQQRLQSIRENMIDMSYLVVSLITDAPEEVHNVIESTAVSLKKIAEKYNITIEKDEI